MTSWAETNLYKVLGVGRQATVSEIRDAYRRLALERHPDKNPGDPRAVGAFQELNEAYEVLSDDGKRRIYDSRCGIAQGHFGTTAWNAQTHGESRSEVAEILRAENRDQEWAEQAQRRASNIVQLAKEVSSLNAAVIELDRKEHERRAEEKSSKGLLRFISSLWSAKRIKIDEEKRRDNMDVIQQRLATSVKLERARIGLRKAEQHHRYTLRRQDQIKGEEGGRRARNGRAREGEGAVKVRRAARAATGRAQGKARGMDSTMHTCRHMKFRTLLNGRHDCGICGTTFNSFVMQCPDCSLMACISCRKSLKMS